ncbi:MAG: hypothetical protein HQK53_03105 [Oligoflexia bacterium]|nr:hypothetical protein [Oligoflexia bacterium]
MSFFIKLLVSLFSVSCIATSLFAVEGGEGGYRSLNWQKMPVTYKIKKEADNSISLTASVFNSDPFNKYCAISASAELLSATNIVKPIVFNQDNLLFKPGRSTSISYKLIADELTLNSTLNEGSFAVNLSCVQVDLNTDLTMIPSPREKCDPAKTDCDNLCPSEIENPQACQLIGKRVTFARNQIESRPIGSDRIGVKLHVANPNTESLICDLIIKIPSINAADDRYILDVFVNEYEIHPSNDQTIAKAINKTEIPAGYKIKASEINLLGTCRFKHEPKPTIGPLVLCNPERRAECNWIK